MALKKRALDLAPKGAWFKSSRSNNGNNCILVAPLAERYVGVADSKFDNSPAFVVGHDAWKAFIDFAS
ncbi:DUF397 domain-containing protein [Streptomyces sp. NPDC001401]|uniref:DUF397 domain-containing protein n=1 Tax=Streptomyces sp. NPDC001401 TaxID=3364570 RepID=UPI00369304D2